MDSLVIPEQISPLVEDDTFSAISLLESGLNCFQQGCYTEGAEFLTLARAQLPPNQVQLVAALNALNQANATHVHAQQALHEASKRFAESDSEQQAQMAALQKLLTVLIEQTNSLPHTRIQPRKNAKDHQPLRLLRSPWTSTKEDRSSPTSQDGNTLPALYITCFGRFEVRRFDATSHPISLCTNLKGQAILRYLITRPKYRETLDILMDELWPDEAPEAAQHKLRVAASALRCSLNKDFISEPGAGYILCKGQGYQLNPAVAIQTDVDEFLALYRAGHEGSGKTAATFYEKACRMYTGPFLAEDLYAEWSFIRREEVSKTYVVMCDRLAEFNLETGCYEAAAKWASAILKVDRCDEEAHRQLIRVYVAQGRRSEALRQYQRCQMLLAEELGVQPMPETQNLFYMLANATDSLAGKGNNMKL